jgi:hypothetical protein
VSLKPCRIRPIVSNVTIPPFGPVPAQAADAIFRVAGWGQFCAPMPSLKG